MNGKEVFGPFWSVPSMSQPADLESWRDWLVNTMILFAVIVFPLSMLATFPIFFQEKLYELVALDVGLYVVIVFRFFVKGGSYKGRGYLWIGLIYVMAISFHIALGPHYARPAWLIMAAVMAALLFGTRAAALAVLLNIAILMTLYWSMGMGVVENAAWADVYKEPFGKWIMFTVNASFITLACSLPVGFLLNRLDISLQRERDALENLKGETEKLQAAYDELERETSDRKEAEKALQKSEEKFRKLVENVNEGIYSMDETGVLTYANPAIERILGYEESEVIGKPFTDFIYEEDTQRQKERFNRLVSGPIGGDEFRLVTKDGEIRWIHSSTRPIFQNRILQGFEGVFFDITDRKHAEEAMTEAKQRYQSLFDSKANLVFVMDESGRFIDANDMALDLFEYKKEDLADLHYIQLLHSDQSLDPVTKAMKEIWETGSQLKPLEVKIRSKNGKTIYVQTGGTLISGKNEIIGVARDVTDQKLAAEEKKKLEIQLMRAQKMEAIGTLAGGIAHDFNNILSAILGYTELCQMSIPKESRASGYLAKILKAGDRAKNLIQQILTYSRQTEQPLKPVSVNDIVAETLKLLRATLPSTIDIKQNIKSDALVMGDPTQIYQIIMNLCTNAGHAMQEKGGTLGVELCNEEFDSDFASLHPDLEPGFYLNLTVSDTGHGMPSDVLDRIFDPFFTTKEREEGTGMGLAVVHGIVKAYGGSIYAHSEPDKGSTFNVYLPAIESGLEADKKLEGVLPKGTEQVLFVDDESALVEIGKQMLESLGYRVVSRISSVEALDLFRTQPERFDLVITDMTMPQMTGDRLAQELITIRKDIPVILCTGFSHRITEEKAKGMGIKGFLMKPLVLRDLANNVRKVLDEK